MIWGLGSPLTGHLIRTVRLVRAVMLLPAFRSIEGLLLAGMVLPFFGTLIVGFTGAAEIDKVSRIRTTSQNISN